MGGGFVCGGGVGSVHTCSGNVVHQTRGKKKKNSREPSSFTIIVICETTLWGRGMKQSSVRKGRREGEGVREKEREARERQEGGRRRRHETRERERERKKVIYRHLKNIIYHRIRSMLLN